MPHRRTAILAPLIPMDGALVERCDPSFGMFVKCAKLFSVLRLPGHWSSGDRVAIVHWKVHLGCWGFT